MVETGKSLQLPLLTYMLSCMFKKIIEILLRLIGF
jgi:hypothetical protein